MACFVQRHEILITLIVAQLLGHQISVFGPLNLNSTKPILFFVAGVRVGRERGSKFT